MLDGLKYDLGLEPMIPEYPIGSDITMINTMYKYPAKDPKTGKYDDGSITIVFRDNVTGEIKHHIIKNPYYVFYYADEATPIDHNQLFIEKERVQQKVVPFKDLEKEIAILTDNKSFYYDNIKMGNRYANRQLHTAKEIFNSDMDINNHYRHLFDLMYQNTDIAITKSFFDIEVDSKTMKGDWVEPGECPVNAISFLNKSDYSVHTFLLRDEKNPLIEEFEKSINKDFFDEVKTFVCDAVSAIGGPKYAKKYEVDKLSYNIYFFDEEIDLLRAFYRMVHMKKPMFMVAWNNAFDTPYIVERIKMLGYDPADIMCDKDFEIKFVQYKLDTRNQDDFAERNEYYNISMDTVVLDQMIHFASRRKSQAKIDSFKLDDIGEMVAKVKKLSYAHITNSIVELPYLDYKTFVLYNIMDVIVQMCIECKTNDLEYVYNKCLINNTSYQKCHRQTIYLIDRFTKEFYKDGYIMGNNNNLNNTKERIRGALVGDPKNTNDYSKLKIRGKAILVVDNLVDFDYKAMYPSISIENNFSPHTQIGKIEIPDKIYEHENRLGIEVWNRSEEYSEAITTQNILLLCSRWFRLANYRELIHDVEEYYNMVGRTLYYVKDGKFLSAEIVSDNKKPECIEFTDNSQKINPVIFRMKMPDTSEYTKSLRRTVRL